MSTPMQETGKGSTLPEGIPEQVSSSAPRTEARPTNRFSFERLAAEGLTTALHHRAAEVLHDRRDTLAAQQAALQQQIEEIDHALPDLEHPSLQ